MHELFFDFLLIFLPTQLGLHLWPSWAMVLGRRVDYLSPTIYLTDILIVCIIISWFFRQKRKFLISNFQFLIKRSNFPFAILFFAFVCLNIFFAGNRMAAVYGWVKVLEYLALGFYVIQTKPKPSSIIFPLSVGLVYSSVIAVMQFILQRSIGGPLWFLGERTFSNISPGIAQFNLCNPLTSVCTLVLRAYSTFPHPNVLGGFLAATLPLIFYELKNGANVSKNKKIFYMITFILGIIALVMTFSRSAWVATVIGISITYAASLKKKVGPLPWCIAGAIIIFIIGGTIGLQDESVVVREALNVSAVQMFKESPIVGKGVDNFLVDLPKSLPSRQIYFLQPVHNIYLLLLAETGIVGFFLFLFVLWKAFGNVSRITYHVSQKNRNSFIIYHLSFIILLLLGLVDHYPLTLQQGQVLFTIFLSLALIR